MTADPRPRAALSSGTTVGSYQIVAVLGAGAMGDVYRARDLRLGRDVALKLLPSSDPASRDLIEREARIVASLNHPNVLAVHDIGVQNGAIYIVTELVDGESLRGVKPPLRKALDIAAQIADALSAAHAAGVMHRDLKPDNVMVTRDGRVKLLDFGIATSNRLPVDVDETMPPGTGVVTGTLGYMAPEQVRAAALDARADIFSFGAVALRAPLRHARVHRRHRRRRDHRGADRRSARSAGGAAGRGSRHRPAVPREAAGTALSVRARSRICPSTGSRRRAAGNTGRRCGGTIADRGSRAAGTPDDELRLANAERLSSLLRFVVEETLNGRASQLKEARIGLEVFGRKADSYDPAIDPIVRVQMGRLRSKLRAYYNARQGRRSGPHRHPGRQLRADIHEPRRDELRARPDRDAAAAADDLRIAVLPIVNMSAGAGEPVLLRRTDGGADQPPGADSATARRRQDVELPVQGRRPRHPRGRPAARREQGARRQRPEGRQSHPRHRAAHQRRRWLSPLVGAVRRRSHRHLRHPRADLHRRAAGAADEDARARVGGARVSAPRVARGVQPLSAGALPLEEANRAGPASGARPLRRGRPARSDVCACVSRAWPTAT